MSKNKPMIIKVREAKENILKSVNMALRDGIPCYLLEPIISELHTQVSKAAQSEYLQAQKHFAEQEEKGADPK